MKRIATILFLVTLLLSGLAQAGEFYKWTDTEGIVHFTDDPTKVPKDFREKTIKIKIEPAAESSSPEYKEESSKQTYTHETESRVDKNKLIKREVERVVDTIWRCWHQEEWAALWEKGTLKSKSSTSKEEFIRTMKLNSRKIKSYKIKDIRSGATSTDSYAEVVFSCRPPFNCPDIKKLVEISLYYYKEYGWGVWLGDIIFGIP